MLNDAFFFVVPFHKLWLSIDTINKKCSSLFPARNKKFLPPNTSKPGLALLQNTTHENLSVSLNVQLQQDPQGNKPTAEGDPTAGHAMPSPLRVWAGLGWWQCSDPLMVPDQVRWWPGLGSIQGAQSGTVQNEPRNRATYDKFSSQEKEPETGLDTKLLATQP